MRRSIWTVIFLLPAFCLGQTTESAWENLKQLRVGQKIEVVEMNLKSHKGTFLAVSDEAISLRVKDQEVSIDRANVFRMSSREKSNRARNTLIGLAIGAGAGLAAGAIPGASYHEEGETGVFMLVTVPVGTGIGAGVGAAMPATGTIYRAGKRTQAAAP